jgi:hypothetical protein
MNSTQDNIVYIETIHTNQKVAVLLPISVCLIGLIYLYTKRKYCKKEKESDPVGSTEPVVEMI